MHEFMSEWAVESCVDGVTKLYLGHSKEWCIKNSTGWKDTILQNVEGTVIEGVLHYTGITREFERVYEGDKIFNLEKIKYLEINPSQYVIKKTLILKNEYLCIDYGKYLYKKPKGKKKYNSI